MTDMNWSNLTSVRLWTEEGPGRAGGKSESIPLLPNVRGLFWRSIRIFWVCYWNPLKFPCSHRYMMYLSDLTRRVDFREYHSGLFLRSYSSSKCLYGSLDSLSASPWNVHNMQIYAEVMVINPQENVEYLDSVALHNPGNLKIALCWCQVRFLPESNH
jgi:hypothetical protein